MRNEGKFRILSESEVERIHEEALRVLESTGVYFDCEEALDVLETAGASVNRATGVVRFPRRLVLDAIKLAPSEIQLYDREGNPCVLLGGDRVHFDPGSCGVRFMESDGVTVRESRAEDLKKIVQVTDALPHIQLQSTAVVANDVPKEIADSYRLYIVLSHSKKPIITGAFSVDGLFDMKELLSAVAGGDEALAQKPRAVFDICPSPPLKWTHISARNIIDCARLGLPMEFVSMPMPGAASPATIAGSVVIHTAETLSGTTLAQLVRPSAKVVWGGAPVVFDMRSGTTPMSAVEATMIGCASTQMGKFYGLPTHTYTCLSDSKCNDSQAGLETAMGAVMGALAGINVISGPGMLDFVGTMSLEKLVIDNEICGLILRLLRGIDVNDDTLATELIVELGPGGDYLNTKHTRQWFKKEVHMPGPAIDRKDRKTWEAQGHTTSDQRARKVVAEILKQKESEGPCGVQPVLDEAMKAVKKRAGADRLPLGPE